MRKTAYYNNDPDCGRGIRIDTANKPVVAIKL
jgi:hypothetical protein